MNLWAKAEARNKSRAEGVKVEVTEYPGWAFWVRPMDAYNRAYARAMVQVSERPEVKGLVQRQDSLGYETTAEDDAIDAAASAAAFGAGCLARWEGVTGPDDAPLPYSPANAERLLVTFPDLFAALRRVAGDPTRFEPLAEPEKQATIEGNSVTASTSPTGRGGKRSAR